MRHKRPMRIKVTVKRVEIGVPFYVSCVPF